MNRIGNETLMAYADGELSGLRRDEVERALAEDPALKARLDEQRRLRARLAAHYGPVADEPMPARIAALLGGGGDAVDLADARRRRARPMWQNLTALAATLVLGLFAGTLVPRGGDGPFAVEDGALLARGELAAMLDSRLASERDREGRARIGVSFAARDGRFCRTFETPALGGLACRGDTGWQLVAAAAPAAASAGGEFRQAGSGSALVLEAAQELMAGEPLDAEGERRARAAGWRNGGPAD